MNDENERDEFIGLLYEQYYSDLILYCRRCFREAGVDDVSGYADEAVQEVFMKASRLYRRLMRHPNIVGWLYKACFNQIRNGKNKFYRSAKHRDVETRDKDDGEGQRMDNECFVDPYDLIQKYEDDEEYRDVKDRIYKALIDSQRVTFSKYYLEGKKIREIHEETGISEGTIKSHLNRIRERLRTLGFDKNIF